MNHSKVVYSFPPSSPFFPLGSPLPPLYSPFLAIFFLIIVSFSNEQGMGRDSTDGLYFGERVQTALKQLNTIQVRMFVFNKRMFER